MKFDTKQIVRSAALAALTLTSFAAHAGNYTWTGGGGAGNTGWNTNANWVSGSKPANDGFASVFFPVNAPGNFQNIASPLQVHVLEIGSGVNTTVGGNTLDFRGASGTFGYIQSFSNSANGITNNLVLTSNLQLLGSGHGTLTIAGVMSGGGGFYSNYADGTVLLTQANTWTGGTDLESGTLLLGSDGALGPAFFTLTTGSALGSFGGPRTIANDGQLFGSGTVTMNSTHTLTFTGQMNLQAASTLR